MISCFCYYKRNDRVLGCEFFNAKLYPLCNAKGRRKIDVRPVTIFAKIIQTPLFKTASKVLTLITLVFGDLFGDVLHLEEQLDPLDGGDAGLGDGRGDTSGEEILEESYWIG